MVINVAGKVYQLNNLDWADKPGFCDEKVCRDIKCEYWQRNGGCISQIVGHACKHLAKGDRVEKDKASVLMKQEKICSNYNKNEELVIELTDDKNSARLDKTVVKYYDQLCKKSEDKIVAGWKSDTNIQLVCGDNYTGFTKILNKRNDILSFYYKNSFTYKKGIENYLANREIKHVSRPKMYYSKNDFRMNYSVFETMNDSNYDTESFNIIEGKLYYELGDGYGVGTKLEYALRNTITTDSDWVKKNMLIFKYYFDPMVARAMIDIHNAMSEASNRNNVSSNVKTLILNNKQHIITMFRLKRAYMMYREMKLELNTTEQIYKAAFGEDDRYILTPEMKSVIGEVLCEGYQEELRELEDALLNYANFRRYYFEDSYDNDMYDTEMDFLSFLVANHMDEYELLCRYCGLENQLEHREGLDNGNMFHNLNEWKNYFSE